MRNILGIILLLIFGEVFGQSFAGQVFMKESSDLYLNQIYVTNLNDHKTVLSNYNGEFSIKAKEGDIVRFTSIISERIDVKITAKHLQNQVNFIELPPYYRLIQEVVIGWRPTGNLRKDVLSLKESEKKLTLANIIGLPAPKGDGKPPVLPIAGFRDGGLSLSMESIFDAISGERKKKQRLYEYEKMMIATGSMKNYFGEEYFTKQKIPVNMIDNFLQFVYSSDNLIPYIEAKNIEATKIYIEKYLPIYIKRLKQSNLMQIIDEKKS